MNIYYVEDKKTTLPTSERHKQWNDHLCEVLPQSALQRYQERMSGRGPQGWSPAWRWTGRKLHYYRDVQMVAQDLWDKKNPL